MTDGGPILTEQQKQYLEGFLAGVKNRGAGGAAVPASSGAASPTGPDAIHVAAQDRFLAAGRKLVPEELAKRAKHPFDMWDEMRANAAAGRFPKGTDVFLHKFHGLFYVAPNQDAFMLRLRLPGGLISASQLGGLADVAERFGGGYAHVTTRANLQIREIGAAHAIEVLEAIDELGLSSRGAGADNIRNLTGSPIAGLDPQELIDTRPMTRELYHLILNHRELYGLPRKFNIAFDGGGRLGVLEDTNDIGFAAVEVDDGTGVPAGVYFRMLLGGITGHGDFGRDSGVLLAPEEAVPAAVAVLRVFIAHGDRTDRRKARLKYLLDAWGFEKFMAEAEAFLPFKWRRVPREACRPRGPVLKHGHVGVHAQRQPGLNYVGVGVPVGYLPVAQMRGLADIAARHGSGGLRLTVWQNLIIPDVPDAALDAVARDLAALGLTSTPSHIRGALVACTGNVGCKFALSNTKAHALAIGDWLEARVTLDQPLNIHLTGCPASCAQVHIGDIGLLATKVDRGDDEVEGYHVMVGGGAGAERTMAREIYKSVPADAAPAKLEAMLRAYLAHRRDGESFHAFVNRHEIDALIRLFDAAALEAAA
ncbi:MAG TPA: NirA family protein [Candidatus Sulfotelmatobacter sp.]|nr:NirA family protein [Candidatus Sulfotelmatobacter sp.]